MERFNYNEGRLHSLEEEIKENTYQINSNTLNIIAPEKIDIEKPIKINSYSLETNEIRENEWDIELKNTPTPSVPQWKEVGTKQDNKTINYNFVKNKRYRIYYNYCETETNKTYGWLIKEFLYEWVPSGDDLYLEYFKTRDDNNTWLLINFQKIYMVIAPYPFSFGKLFKLEELQE